MLCEMCKRSDMKKSEYNYVLELGNSEVIKLDCPECGYWRFEQVA